MVDLWFSSLPCNVFALIRATLISQHLAFLNHALKPLEGFSLGTELQKGLSF